MLLPKVLKRLSDLSHITQHEPYLGMCVVLLVSNLATHTAVAISLLPSSRPPFSSRRRCPIASLSVPPHCFLGTLCALSQ